MAHGKYYEELSQYKECGEELSNWQITCKSLSLSFFLIQAFLVVALSFSLQRTFINGLPTICLITVVNETSSNLTRMNKEWQEIAFCWKVLNA